MSLKTKSRQSTKPKQLMPKGFAAGFECAVDFTFREDIDDALEQVDLIELIPESYLFDRQPDFIRKIAKSGIPVVGHSVDLSLGADEPFKQKHFDQIKALLDQVNCVVFSDHLCMTGAGGMELGQLTTLPFTQEGVAVASRKIETVQKQLDIPFMIENITNRFLVPGAELSETQFINKILHNTGCGFLFDVTNTYINSVNHKFDPFQWIDEIDTSHLMGVHLAGGIKEDGFMYDTHSKAVHPQVWKLLEYVTKRAQPKFVIVEWDQHAPSLDRILKEVKKAEAVLEKTPTKVVHKTRRSAFESVGATI